MTDTGLGARLSTRWDAGLPVGRTRDRLSAYVYGNILVLAALGTTTPDAVDDGHAVVVVLATTVTTYLAHVLADAVGGAVGRRDDDAEASARARLEWRHELRDAVPIISSGSMAVLVLALGWWGVLGPDTAVVVASLVVVLRLASLGVAVGRLSGSPPTRGQLGAGLVIAFLGAVVVGLKVWLLH